MADSVELVNYIKDIEVVKIIDKEEKELFSDKEYEKLSFTFVPTKLPYAARFTKRDTPENIQLTIVLKVNRLSSNLGLYLLVYFMDFLIYLRIFRLSMLKWNLLFQLLKLI